LDIESKRQYVLVKAMCVFVKAGSELLKAVREL
jgi:hypothetical protein